MKTRNRISFLILMAAITTLITACSSSNNPSSPSSNASSVHAFSAFTTIGSSTYLVYPAVIRYSSGHLWVVDYSGNSFQKWSTDGSSTKPVTKITTYNGGQFFNRPWGVTIDPSNSDAYMVDGNYGALANQQGVVFNQSGGFRTVFGNSELSAATADPDGIAVNSSGTTVYVVGENTNLVYAFSINGTSYTYQLSFGKTGSAPATIDNPYSLFVDSGNNIWVASASDASAKEYDPSGNFIQSFTSSVLGDVTDVAVDASGNVYVTDDNKSQVVEFNPSGTVTNQFGSGILSGPEGIALDGAGNVYVSDSNHARIVGFH